jgi:hypothetical protein
VDKTRVADELAVHVVPPLVVDPGPVQDFLDTTVVDREQLRALARQELAGCDGTDPVALGTRLDVADRPPQPQAGPSRAICAAARESCKATPGGIWLSRPLSSSAR